MSEWRETTLGEFVSLQRGHDLTEPERRPGIVPIMGSAGQNGCHDTALANGPGIVIGRSGASFGQVHCCMDDYWPHNTTLYVTNFHGNDPLFAYYLLKNINFSRYNSGSAQPSLNRNYIYHILISVPKPGTQRAIARFLGDLDDKIELNRKINQTLEQIAQAIFTSWFVDFEPVKAKIDAKSKGLDLERAAMCAISGKVDDELDQLSPKQKQQLAATAALFPEELETTKLGVIPKGWEASLIGNEVTVCGGGTPSTTNPDFWDGDFAWITPKDLSQQADNVLIASERTISEAGVNKISSGQLPIGTVLLSSRAPIGYLALTMIPVSINQGFIAMICNKRLPNTYVLQWATTNLDAIKQRGSGTTFAEISKSTFRPMHVLVPSEEILIAFQAEVELLYAEITAKVRESRTLANLRDAMLSKLLSGQISC